MGRRIPIGLLAVLIACGAYRPPATELVGVSETSVGGTSVASEGSGSSSEGAEESGAEESGASTEAGSEDSGSSATGDGNRLSEACDQYCGTRATCFAVDADLCELQCEADFLGGKSAECVEAQLTWLNCVAVLRCDDQPEGDETGAGCAAEAESKEMACNPTCVVENQIAGPDPSTCRVTLDCGRSVDCMLDDCICLEGGEVVGSCDALTVCGLIGAGGDTALDGVLACCGW